jgi:predicted O-methyltransferase YrrM
VSQTAQTPRRVLVVGRSDREGVLAAAKRLPADGLMICIDGDRHAAARAIAHFEREGVARRVSVMVGEPALFLRKVAGPFELILASGGHGIDLAEELRAKLAPGGRILDL